MGHLPVPVAPAEVPTVQDLDHISDVLQAALSAAHEFALAENSDSTRHAYASDLRDFTGWCLALGLDPVPAEVATVASYLAHLAVKGLKASTIKRRVAAIRSAHRLKGFESPSSAEIVRAVHKGIRNRIGTRTVQKAPATAQALTAMLKRIPRDTLAGKRDRAILLLGFGAALRRSEIVALNFEDVVHRPEGVMVTIRRSKTDQEGHGQEVAVPRGTKLKAPAALEEWTAAAGIASGPLFPRIRRGDHVTTERLTGHAVAHIVKRWAKAARLDPDQMSGHSLRAGFLTSALEAGADVFAAADQGRWKRLETVREYDRRNKMFANNAGKGFL